MTKGSGLMIHTYLIHLNKMKRYTDIPECWDEVTPRQFKYLLKSVFRMMTDQSITSEDVLNDLADFMLGRKHSVLPWQNERYMLLVHEIADRLEWMFGTDDENQVFLDFSTTKNLLPAIEGLRGPQSHGSDLRFGEYRTAVDFFNRYTEGHRLEDLDCLVGILYRSSNPDEASSGFDGQYREPFNKFKLEKYASRAKYIPETIKWGVYLWFGYFCRYIIEGGEFIIEGNTVSFASIFERSDSDPDDKKENSIGMTSVLFSLADTGTFGNASQTDETELFRVLLKLLHDKQTIDELKKS
jgi:hypothetical protein